MVAQEPTDEVPTPSAFASIVSLFKEEMVARRLQEKALVETMSDGFSGLNGKMDRILYAFIAMFLTSMVIDYVKETDRDLNAQVDAGGVHILAEKPTYGQPIESERPPDGADAGD